LDGDLTRFSYIPKPSARLLLWVTTALVVTLVLLPVFYLLWRAMGDLSAAWAGLWRISTFWVLLRTIGLALAVTVVSAGVAIPLAWLLARTDLPARRFWSIVLPLPLVLPSYVAAYLYVSLLGPRGLLQDLLEPFGVARLPSIYGFWGALFCLVVLSYPYLLLGVRGALVRMDPALEEAARSLGYSPWQAFLRVTLPLLRPALASSSLLVALYCLRDFGAVAIFRFDSFTRVLYTQYKTLFNPAQGAALALLLVVLSLFLVSLEVQTRGRVRYARTSGTLRPIARFRLGKWRWAAFAYCALIALLAVGTPLLGLGYWLVRGLLAGRVLATLWQALGNSVLVAGLAAGLTVLAGLPIALLITRIGSSKGEQIVARWIERFSYVGFSLPGLVVALGLVFFGARFVPFLYQQLPMLLLGYLILHLSEASAPLRTALLQLRPSLEEAARSLGYSSVETFLHITLPLIRPGIVTATTLVFLNTLKELPVTLLLAPSQFPTLATSVWSAVSDAFFAQAAFPALLLILVSSVPLAIFTLRTK
jgi:iron(III) transport system permease protein